MGDLAIRQKRDSEMEEYLQELPSMHLEPLWDRLNSMVPPIPNPSSVPHLWEYKTVLPYLNKAGAMVPEEEAERRVLMLVNPAMHAPHTTDTIYGGLQLVNPGETAPAHRHIAYACRFIIDGTGFTAVEGKKLALKRGDVVVTPSWHWHDHGNEGDDPIVWLDALNLPLFTYARVNFAQGYGEKRYPSTVADSADWLHPWSKTQAALDSQSGSHAIYHYKTEDGSPLSTTLGVQAERVSCLSATKPSQDSSSFLYHCFEGDGQTLLTSTTGKTTVIRWTSRDTFAVPAWYVVQHVNLSTSETAYLVAVNDSPFLDNLGLRRPQADH